MNLSSLLYVSKYAVNILGLHYLSNPAALYASWITTTIQINPKNIVFDMLT